MAKAGQTGFFVILFTMLISSVAYGQTQQEKIQQAEMEAAQMRQAQIDRTLEAGINAMNTGKHEQANDYFKEVLKASRVVPTDLTFYFGKNSFYMGKYGQSVDWLNKYIELKGTAGQFYEEATRLLAQSNQAVLLIRDEERKEAKAVLSKDYDIDCGPTGKVVCPVCSGNGVIIERGRFGDIYKTCPYSDKHGYLTCEEYNLLLKGELDPKF